MMKSFQKEASNIAGEDW